MSVDIETLGDDVVPLGQNGVGSNYKNRYVSGDQHDRLSWLNAILELFRFARTCDGCRKRKTECDFAQWPCAICARFKLRCAVSHDREKVITNSESLIALLLTRPRVSRRGPKGRRAVFDDNVDVIDRKEFATFFDVPRVRSALQDVRTYSKKLFNAPANTRNAILDRQMELFLDGVGRRTYIPASIEILLMTLLLDGKRVLISRRGPNKLRDVLNDKGDVIGRDAFTTFFANMPVLRSVLDDVRNPFIETYETAKECLDNAPDVTRDVILNPQMKLFLQDGFNKRGTNVPTSIEILLMKLLLDGKRVLISRRGPNERREALNDNGDITGGEESTTFFADIPFLRSVLYHVCNPLIGNYETAKECLDNAPDVPRDIILNPQMKLFLQDGFNKRGTNVPTSTEIAFFIPDDMGGATCRNIILTKSSNGEDGSRLFRIDKTHPAYMPLHYVHFFLTGQPGWGWTLQKSKADEIIRKRITHRAHARYWPHKSRDLSVAAPKLASEYASTTLPSDEYLALEPMPLSPTDWAATEIQPESNAHAEAIAKAGEAKFDAIFEIAIFKSSSNRVDIGTAPPSPRESYIVPGANGKIQSDIHQTSESSQYSRNIFSTAARFLAQPSSRARKLTLYGQWLKEHNTEPPMAIWHNRFSVSRPLHDTLTVSDKVKTYVESFSGREWDWWPAKPPERPIDPDKRRIQWQCNCGHKRFADCSPELARKCVRIGELALEGGHRKHGPSEAEASEHTKRSNEAPAKDRQSTGQEESSQTSANTTLSGASNTGQHQASNAVQTESRGPGSINDRPNQFFVLLGIEHHSRYHHTSWIDHTQLEISGLWYSDLRFFNNLREQYRSLRGFSRYWLSPFIFSHCSFFRYTRFGVNELDPKGRNLPEDQAYVYKPCPPGPHDDPPISAHEFNRRFYTTICNPCGRPEAVTRIPKRSQPFQTDVHRTGREDMWGLHVELCPSFFRFLLWATAIIAGGLALMAWWLAHHNNDLQNASVPITIIMMATTALYASLWEKMK